MTDPKFWSSEGLIAQLRELYDVIYVTECSGVSDLILYSAIVKELDRRGYLTGKVKTVGI